jgi:hypothetical protein
MLVFISSPIPIPSLVQDLNTCISCRQKGCANEYSVFFSRSHQAEYMAEWLSFSLQTLQVEVHINGNT